MRATPTASVGKHRHRGRRWMAAVTASVAMASSAACSSAANDDGSQTGSLADMEPVALRYAAPGPEEVNLGQAFLAFAAEVEEASDGKVTFEPYWSNTLLDPLEVPEGLTGGVADLSIITPSYYPEQFPVAT